MAETSRIRPDFRSAPIAPDLVASAFDAADEDLSNVLKTVTAGECSGIVSPTDPTSPYSPLWVVAVEDQPMYWDITPGVAVSASGKFLSSTDTVRVSLVSVDQGAENVIVIRKTLTPSGHYVVTNTGEVVDVAEIESSEIGCMTYDAFVNLKSTASSDVFGSVNYDDIVALGVVVWDTSAGPTLYTEATSRYSWLRPWFTAVDVKHRSQVGTGTVSDTNPHGTSLADLLLGDTTIYSQLTSSGMVYSKDYSTAGIPGVYCYQRFLQDAVKIDNSGEITRESPYGRLGARYVVLDVFPNTITSIRKVNSKKEMCGALVPRSNIVVFPAEETFTDAIDIWYFKTDSLSVSATTQTSITFRTMQNSDLVVTNSQALPSVGNTTLQFRRYGTIPRTLNALVADSGKLFADPYVIVPTTLITEAQKETQSNQIELYAPARLGVGVSYFAATTAAYMAIRVTGIAENGDVVSEVLEFRGTNVIEAGVGSTTESSSQVLFTENTFASFTQWEIITSGAFAPVSLNFAASVTIYARTDIAKARLASVARMHWTGSSITDVRDARRILPIVSDGEYGFTALTQAAESIGLSSQIASVAHHKMPARLICAEDFSQPKHINITKCAWRGPKLQSPMIPTIHTLSTSSVECYKSRMIPTVMSQTYTFQVCVVLFGTDVVADKGSVRCVVRDWQDVEYETTLIPYAKDPSNRTFLGYSRNPYRAVSFVISGTANGFAAFLTQDENPDEAYYTTFTLTGN